MALSGIYLSSYLVGHFK